MNYEETVNFLFTRLPVFQRDGAAAYKPGLDTILNFCEAIGNPHKKLKTIHIGGTNGKGSSSHSIASVFQEAGYKTGLYTSPHLFDFRERFRINGKKIPKETVVRYIEQWMPLIDKWEPSFFELTVAMAFAWFAEEQTEIAVIEVGMGGRLDSTNILIPELALITNIGLDHQQFLGHSHAAIASEKAGIIKAGVPIVIGEHRPDSDEVFRKKTLDLHAPITFAEDVVEITGNEWQGKQRKVYWSWIKEKQDPVFLELAGNYQLKNFKGIVASLKLLQQKGWKITDQAIKKGLSKVVENTGLLGRWQTLKLKPRLICDTGHNEDGIKEVVSQLLQQDFKNLWLIWGMVADKDHQKIINLLPKQARILVTSPQINRALPKEQLARLFMEKGFDTLMFDQVGDAVHYALKKAHTEDLIFVGGSTFMIADIPAKFFTPPD